MNCPGCHQAYSQPPSSTRTPRVLLHCGHTLCESCINQQIPHGTVQCSMCKLTSQATSATRFPVNESLLAVISHSQMPQAHLCKAHKKKLEAYCEKDRQLICVECTLSTHRLHKACLVSQKAKSDRTALKECLNKVEEGIKELAGNIETLAKDQVAIESAYLDYEVQISLCFKSIIEELKALQDKQLDKLKKNKEEQISHLLSQKKDLADKMSFFQQMESIYHQIIPMGDLDFLKEEAKRSLITENCRYKRVKANQCRLDFRSSQCFQEMINCIQDRMTYDKKMNNQTAIQISPNRKSKEPAILQVDLAEEYMRRRVSNRERESKKEKEKQGKQKGKPTKKTITIGVDRSGSRAETRFIKEGSGRKCSPSDELEISQNCTPVSVGSFMRSSRASDFSLDQTSLKHSFADFSQLAIQDRVYLIGGRTHLPIERHSSEGSKPDKISQYINRRGAHTVYLKAYSKERCLLVGGQSVGNAHQLGTQIYDFNFKTQKISRTQMNLPGVRNGTGCVSYEDSFYLVGGSSEKKSLNTLEKYTPLSGRLQVSKLESMRSGRSELGCCLGFDGQLYAVGGVSQTNNILGSCERYNFQRGTWQVISSMRHHRRGCAVVSLPQGIVVIGGHSGQQTLREVEIYQFERGEWRQLPKILEARCYHSGTVARDYNSITIYGGLSNNIELDSKETLILGDSQWRMSGRMRDPRCLHASIACPL